MEAPNVKRNKPDPKPYLAQEPPAPPKHWLQLQRESGQWACCRCSFVLGTGGGSQGICPPNKSSSDTKIILDEPNPVN